MTRVMVLGYELPALAAGAIEARSYRTWQFVEPLLADGHEVCLVTNQQAEQYDIEHSLDARLHYHRIDMQRRGWPARLNQLHDRFDPQAILAVMFNNCLRVTRLSTDHPIWMDLYGDKLAETQIAEYTQHSSRGRRNMMRYLRLLLQRGDVYSTCSTPQKYALIGQLGMVGRLNQHTVGYEFVHPVLPGASGRPHITENGTIEMRESLPPDAFMVLWCGGYNVWTDIDTLFCALEQAMQRDARIIFVSVGGAVGLKQNLVYEHFRALIETSAYRQRFHLLGWKPASEIPNYYRQADVGINLDGSHYETMLGTRTRLVEMMGQGLPVITSSGCELSGIIGDQELGLIFPTGKAGALRDQILALADDPALRQRLAERARHYTTTQLSFGETTRPFLEWVGHPNHAPDRVRKSSHWQINTIEYYLRSLARGLLWKLWALERAD